jgi:hypothetical protein
MRTLVVTLALCAVATAVQAATIAQWNFNSAISDANTATGTLLPSSGSGVFALVGGVTNGYAGGATLDPAPAADNSAVNTGMYPAQGTANKTGGPRFAVNTAGFTNIVVTWAQRVSNTGSRFWRFQYSTNGVDFLDFLGQTVITNGSSASFSNQVVSLAAISTVENNASFMFQIVAEFDGGGTAYGAAGNTSSYSGGPSGTGVVRFDYVTVSGDVAGVVNTPPSISAITNITMRAESTYGPVPFVVNDVETPAGSLTIDKSSSNPSLLPASGISVLGGGGGADDTNRTVSLTPTPGQTGSASVTLTVIDGGGRSNSAVFVVTVVPTNTPPVVSAILNQSTLVATPVSVPFTVGDAEAAASDLTVTAVSLNTNVLPLVGVALSGTESNRSITLTPAAAQIGHAAVSITVSDGILTTNRVFVLSVVPSAGTLFYEPFNYADGSLSTNSSGLWQNHGGTPGDLSVLSDAAFISASFSEDLNARLRGEPYNVSTGTNLYYSLRFWADNLPTSDGGYFAHFIGSSSAFRARLIVSTTNAPLFYYRVGIGNGVNSATNSGYAEIPTDITFGETNTVVVRYNVGTGRSTLWLNPTNESDPSVTATDILGSTNNILQFALRQTTFQGDINVDDVRVAVTFDEALGLLPQNYRLRIWRDGTDVKIAWPTAATGAGFSLQKKTDLGGAWGAGESSAVVGDENVVTLSGTISNAFYRLIK